jgi:hypothetical protein
MKLKNLSSRPELEKQRALEERILSMRKITE